jgi:hypothetical protein
MSFVRELKISLKRVGWAAPIVIHARNTSQSQAVHSEGSHNL